MNTHRWSQSLWQNLVTSTQAVQGGGRKGVGLCTQVSLPSCLDSNTGAMTDLPKPPQAAPWSSAQ